MNTSTGCSLRCFASKPQKLNSKQYIGQLKLKFGQVGRQPKPVCLNYKAHKFTSLNALSISRSTPLQRRISPFASSCSTNRLPSVLRGSGSHFFLQFSENHRLFAQTQKAIPCFNFFKLKPQSSTSGSRRGQLVNSLASKTTVKMVLVVS